MLPRACNRGSTPTPFPGVPPSPLLVDPLRHPAPAPAPALRHRCYVIVYCSLYANTAVKGEVAAGNSLYVGSYNSEKDGAVVFSGVGHAVDDENYLATKVI